METGILQLALKQEGSEGIKSLALPLAAQL